MSEILEMKEYKTICAEYIPKAIDILAINDTIDLIILDYMVHPHTAIDFVTLTENTNNIKSIPIILITALNNHKAHERFAKVLIKPINIEDLLNAVAHCVRNAAL